jgi:hypothetical protein
MSVYSTKAQPTRFAIADLLIVSALPLAILGFGAALMDLIHRWNQQEEYRHGFLIVALWLLWSTSSGAGG